MSGAERLEISTLYERYGDMVLARCRALMRNDADAEEACQEVFLRALRFHESFRGESSPSTWLYRVATNTCLMRLRSSSRRREDLVEVAGEALPSPGPSISQELSASQLLGSLLGTLDEVTGAIVVYTYVDGLTQDEIAPLVGLGASGVRKRLARFREGLTGPGRTEPDGPPAAPPAASGTARRPRAR